ncbi:MAG TPA: hypothetical protein VFG02_08460 [Nitrospirota bacterium]|nr:hypothetical protein [Nitrospirota bacterium]
MLISQHRHFRMTVAVFGAALTFVLAMPPSSWAHGVVGQRFFPTTFAVDDPFISDEFSVLYNSIKMNDEAGGPRIQTSSLDVGYSKRIISNFGIEVDESYQRLHTEGDGTVSGYGNLGVNVKYQFYTSDEHETTLSIGISDEIGNTGNHNVSDRFSTISPAFYFGKGFGDLFESTSFLRPLAVTGVIGPNIPTQKTTDDVKNPTTLTWAFTVQYSLMYLQSVVKDIGLDQPFNRMVFVVEFPMETCLNADCKNQTTGTINPGIAWIGRFTELGIAAEIPMNPRSGAGTGVFVLFHLFIDDLFPKSIGRPIFP